MTQEEANEMYLLIKEKTNKSFPEWDEERKNRFLELIKQNLREKANNGK